MCTLPSSVIALPSRSPGECGECEHAGAGTTLAHAEISAYNRVRVPPGAVSRDESLSSGGVSTRRSGGVCAGVRRLGGSARARRSPTRPAPRPPSGPTGSDSTYGEGSRVSRRPVPSPGHHEVHRRAHEQDDRHPHPPAQAEHVVELDGVDPQRLDPAATGGVDHHVEREHPAVAELVAAVEVEQQGDAGEVPQRLVEERRVEGRAQPGSSCRSGQCRGRSPGPTAAWSVGRRAPG